MCITRNVLRIGLIAGLALGGTALFFGPGTVANGIAQVRTKAQNVVDNCIDDPVALQRQLSQLAKQYPARIEDVESEIAEVDRQIALFDRDIRVAEIMVRDTTDDLNHLKALVSKAESHRTAQTASYSPQPVFVRFQGVRFSVDEAYREGTRINTVRTTTADRLEHDKVQVQFLEEQKQRLAEILGELTTEYDQYQAQLWQLERQIDAIERNDRLIEMTEAQQATLDGYKRFGKVQNLQQIESKLAELRRKQESQLKHLAKRGVSRDYEKAAEYELDMNDGIAKPNPFDDDFDAYGQDEDDDSDDDDDAEAKSIAFRTPIVIDTP